MKLFYIYIYIYIYLCIYLNCLISYSFIYLYLYLSLFRRFHSIRHSIQIDDLIQFGTSEQCTVRRGTARIRGACSKLNWIVHLNSVLGLNCFTYMLLCRCWCRITHLAGTGAIAELYLYEVLRLQTVNKVSSPPITKVSVRTLTCFQYPGEFNLGGRTIWGQRLLWCDHHVCMLHCPCVSISSEKGSPQVFFIQKRATEKRSSWERSN